MMNRAPTDRESLAPKASLLSRSPLFSSLSPADLNALARSCQELRFRKDQFIFLEGDDADWLFVVKEGRVKILKHSVFGKNIIIRVVSPGELMGEVAMFDRKPYPASAQALEETTVYRLSRGDLLSFVERSPRVGLDIIGALVGRLRDAYTVIQGLATDSVDRRVAVVLLKLAQTVGTKEPGGTRLNASLSRQDLADLVGCTKESVCRTMAKLRRDGVLRSSHGQIVILAPDGLAALSHEASE